MRYFYFILYRFLSKIPTNDTPKTNALILLVALQSLNVLSFFMVVNYFVKLELSKNYAIAEGIILYIVLLVFNYFYVFRKLKLIITKYQNETKNKKLIGFFLFFIYIVGSLIFFFGIGEFIVNK